MWHVLEHTKTQKQTFKAKMLKNDGKVFVAYQILVQYTYTENIGQVMMCLGTFNFQRNLLVVCVNKRVLKFKKNTAVFDSLCFYVK